MTILVAVKKNGRVFLGADRITTFGSEYYTDLVGSGKIIKLRHAYLATSGYSLMDNVIEHLVSTSHKMVDNPFRNRADVFSFFLELYGELKKTYTLIDTGKETYAGIYNAFFVITPRSIFGVASNLSVNEFPQYATQGSGADYALGCLYGIYDSVNDGYELVRLALESACHFCVSCKEPLDIIEVTDDDFKQAPKGYKTLGKGLRTLPKRKTPGSLLPLMKNGHKESARKPSAIKTVKAVTARATKAQAKANGKRSNQQAKRSSKR
jgi:ATP-dependent protease HslVU (ClpYQ) peptidase subunit